MALHNYLVQLFVCPITAELTAQIVQNQKRRIYHLIEYLVVPIFAIRPKCRPQKVH